MSSGYITEWDTRLGASPPTREDQMSEEHRTLTDDEIETRIGEARLRQQEDSDQGDADTDTTDADTDDTDPDADTVDAA